MYTIVRSQKGTSLTRIKMIGLHKRARTGVNLDQSDQGSHTCERLPLLKIINLVSILDI